MKKTLTLLFLLLLLTMALTSCGECEHEWGQWTIVSHSTCSERGTIERSCSSCGEIQTDFIDVSDHKYDEENIVWSWNEYESATATVYCIYGCETSRQIVANISSEIEEEATCLDAGKVVYTATIKIGDHDHISKKEEIITALGHVEVTDAAVVATCASTGLTEGSHCANCDEILLAQEIIEKLPHKEVSLLSVIPSCSEEGLTEGKKCSVCGTVTVAQEPIAKLPHTEETVVGTAPTCYATGLTDGKKCSVCKQMVALQGVLPKISCDYESVVTAPTCEEQGFTTHTCSMCNNSFIDAYVDEIGHNWGAWEVSGAHTLRNCTNDCNCGKYQRITSLNATYNGIRLLTGESVWKNDLSVTATLSDGEIVTITDFTLENDVMTIDGTNYVDVKFHTASTKIGVPAIYDNLPGVTSTIEFTYDEESALQNDAVTIEGFTGSTINVVIPSYIVVDGVRIPVRHIGYSAFYGQENIKSVVIPDSVYTVDDEAFNHCIRIASVTFGKGLTTIGSLAFGNCISLSEVAIPTNVITIVGYWNGGAFENCTGLKKVTIGDDTDDVATVTIGQRSFQSCTALTEVYIGNQVKSIDDNAFNGCSALKTVTIGAGVKTIGAYAFNNCEALTSIVIPDSVTTIGQEAFYNCIRMTSVTFGKGLTMISGLAFYNCMSLSEVTIPTNVITIEGYWNGGAFENCTGLKKVTIGDDTDDVATVTIGQRSFQSCTALTEVYIGNQVKSIDDNAFNGCSALKTVTIGAGVKTIGAYAFNNCEALTSIVIPDSVTTIGQEAFYNCIRMTSVTFGKGLTTIGGLAFYNCISLTEVVIPANVITIEGYWNGGAFENCTGLKKVTIGDDSSDIAVTTIGERAFAYCTALSEVYIGKNVKTIADDAFEGCDSLN